MIDELTKHKWQNCFAFFINFSIASTVIIFSLISQFFAHPVIFNLMNDKWLGKFGRMKRCSWLSLERWLWILLHIWCLFDLVMFPFVLTVYVYYKILKLDRKNKNKLEHKGMKEQIHILNQAYFSIRVCRKTYLCYVSVVLSHRLYNSEKKKNFSFISFNDCFKFKKTPVT